MIKCERVLMSLLPVSIVVLLLLAGCSSPSADAPVETDRDTLLIPPVSVIAVPVRYPLGELEGLINEKLKGTFVRKHIPISKREDSLYIEVSRRAPISLSRKGHTLFYSLPLRIKGTYKAKLAGIKITNSKPVEADVTIDMATTLALDRRWNLVTTSQVRAIHWVADPELDLGVVKLNLRHPLEKMLTEKEGELMGSADKALDKMIDTRKIVHKLWLDLQKPILVNKKKKNVWIKAYGTDLSGILEDDDPEMLSLRVELKAMVQTLTNPEEAEESNPVLPEFKRQLNGNDSLMVYLHARIPFEETNKILQQEFKNKELKAQGFSTRIRKIRLYGTEKGVAVELKVAGDVDGTLYAEGVPAYDPISREVSLKNFAFSVHSENMLLESADWLLHSNALDALKGKLAYKTDALVNKLPELITRGIEKGKSGNKINVSVKGLDITPHTIITTKNDIQIILVASARAVVELEKQVFVKKKGKV